MHLYKKNHRLSVKRAYAAEFVGDTERWNRSAPSVREDLSTGSTSKLPAEVAFCRKSHIYRLVCLWLFIQPLGLTTVAKPKVRLGMSSRQAQLLLTQYETAKSVYQSQAYADAKSLFGELKNVHHPPLLAPYIHFYYALTAYHNGERSVAKEAFGEIQKKFPDWHKQNEVHYWYAQCSFQEGACAEALASLALIKDQKMAQAILHMKKYFLKQITNHAYLETLIEKFPQEAIIKDILHKKAAREAYLTQDFASLDKLKEKYHFTDYIYNPLKNLACKHKTAYNVAVFLPFFVEEFNYETCKNQFVIELYQGIQLARERLSQEGIVINLFAFDTKRDKAVTQTLLEQEAMAYMDLIIGPLYPNTIPLVAAFAKKHKINLVNPISDNPAIIHGNPFAFLFQPDLETCAQKAAQLTLSGLSQRSNEEACIAVFYGREQKEMVQATLYKHIVEQRLGKPTDLFLQLSNETIKDFLAQAHQQKEKENIENRENRENREEEALDLKKITHIYVASQNEFFVSNIISLCLKLGIKPQIIGHEQWIKKEILNINQLKRLPILFLSPNYMDYGSAALGTFRKKFFEKNSTWPNEKSYIGYEMMLFFGRMLGRYGTYFQKKWQNMHYKCLIFQGLAYGKHRANQHIPVLRFVKDKFIVEPCDYKG